MQSRHVLVLGGAHLDRRGRIFGNVVPGASNPGRWMEEPGGGGFNVARNLARLGHDVTMVSARGGDVEGERVSIEATSAGIHDRPITFLDRRTPSYTAFLEADGNLVIALADMELYDLFLPRRLTTHAMRDLLDAADIVISDANLPMETLAALSDLCNLRNLPLYGITISPAKAIRYRPILSAVHTLFMNEAEARALSGITAEHPRDWPDIFKNIGLKSAVITRGRLGAVAFDQTGTAILAPTPVETVGDVTGAGDALAAGYIDSLAQNMSILPSLEQATALAGLTVQSEFATVAKLDRASLNEAIRHGAKASALS